MGLYPKISAKLKMISAQLFVFMAICLSACEEVKTNSVSNRCAANTAVILVNDGGMVRSCGCAETANQSFGLGDQFQCTIAAGTAVEFYVFGIQRPHQLNINNVYTFAPRYPGSSDLNPVDVYLFTSTGSFSFSDVFTNTGGTIVVQ